MAESNVIQFHIDYDSGVATGGRVISGTGTMGNGYHTGGGDILNLLNYYNSSSYPTVVVTSAGGYLLEHNKGTATAGKVKAYYVECNATTMNGAAANYKLCEVLATVNLSTVNFGFIAFGQRPDNV